MKRSWIAAIAAVVVTAFFTATALCFGVLNGAAWVAAVESGQFRIVLDAGHGGVDGGVVGRTTGLKESDLNLSITHFLKDELTDMGFDVILTRKTEAGLYDTATKGFKKRDMQRRKELIEAAKPDLVLSIHQNFYPSGSVRGGQVFYSKKSEDGKALAIALQRQLNELYATEGVKARAEKSGEYYMLECSVYPSVIVECGFLSNSADERLLQSKTWQKKLASSIAAGVVGYFDGAAA